jgi:putative Holliday junction resolvase
MRALGLDIGKRRVGLAISDASRTLARPLETIAVDGRREAVELVGRAIDRLSAEEDGLDTIVVGLPSRLDGTPTTETTYVSSFVAALRHRTNIAIVTEGERLTSHEAERRLASRERDWRKRKAKLDAAAAAIILQDYLDRG